VLGNDNPFGVVLATLIGVAMYAHIFSTIPIAEALLFKGARLGTILSFMMAVTTRSMPSMILLAQGGQAQAAGTVHRHMHGRDHRRGLFFQRDSGIHFIGG
jgi:uncharacterized protein